MRTHALMVTAMLAAMGIAANADATVVNTTTFKGIQVIASFFGSTPITCENSSEGEFFVNGFLSGAEQVFKSHGSKKFDGNAVVVDVFFSDTCTGESRFASGAVSNGLNPPSRNLEFASMEGSTLVQDFFDGAQFPFWLDVNVRRRRGDQRGALQGAHEDRETETGTVSIVHSDFPNAKPFGGRERHRDPRRHHAPCPSFPSRSSTATRILSA